MQESTQTDADGGTDVGPDIFTARTHLKPYEYTDFLDYVDAVRNSYWVHEEFNFDGDVQDGLPREHHSSGANDDQADDAGDCPDRGAGQDLLE